MAIFGSDVVTKLFVERQAAQFCQALRNALTGMTSYQAWLTGVADADLTTLGFSAAEIAYLRGAFYDGTALSAIASGKLPPSVTTGVKVYRGTAAGAENVLVTTLGAVVTYTDNGGAGSAFSPPTVSTALLPPPSGLAAVANTGSSAFTAGTYYWKITGLNAAGETTGSIEASATLANGGTATLTWNALPAGYPQPSAVFSYLTNVTALIGPA